MEHEFDYCSHLLAEVVWDPRELSLDDSLVEALHVIGPKRWYERAHLVEHTAQRPNVTLAVVGLISPHFWARIIWCTRLSVAQTFFDDFRDVEVTKFCLHVFEEE